MRASSAPSTGAPIDGSAFFALRTAPTDAAPAGTPKESISSRAAQLSVSMFLSEIEIFATDLFSPQSLASLAERKSANSQPQAVALNLTKKILALSLLKLQVKTQLLNFGISFRPKTLIHMLSIFYINQILQTVCKRNS
jgi:hypothetical protein